jgi:RNA polymerase sigma factor (sigma-70 family)
VTASGELSLPVSPDVPAAPNGNGKHHGTEVNTLVDLYRHHQQRIYRYCLALLRNPDDAEDATQETFTRAAPFLPNLPGDLSAYLTTVARNICCDVVRARSRRSVPIETVPLADRAVSPERQSVDWDVVRRMWRQLSPSERLLFAYTFAGYKYEEIASRTGMSRPSVSVGLARARRRLRDLAAATGTLALLPAGIRRLVERFSRRANAAVASAQGQMVALVDQVGTIALSLFTGLFAAGTTAVVAAPALAPVAQHLTQNTHGSLPGAVSVSAEAPAAAATQLRGPSSSAPAAPVAQTPVIGAAAPLLPGGQATPADMTVTTMAVSPAFASDHTVFVGGPLYRDACTGYVACEGLFRSSDGGASWSRLSFETYEGGPVLLSPAYPSDPAVFVLGNAGLDESAKGDGSFSTVIPLATDVGFAPDAPPGAARIAAVIAGTRLALYDAGSGTTTQGPQLPIGFTATGVAYTSPTTLAVTGYQVVAPSQVAAFMTCTIGGSCSSPVTFTETDTVARLIPSPDVFTDHVVVAYGSRHLYVSRDGGLTFSSGWSAPGEGVHAASIGQGPAGLRIGLAMMTGPNGDVPAARMSDDLGQSFTSITGDIDATTIIEAVHVLPGGNIVAALAGDATHRFALRETTGNGHWTTPF